MTSAPAVHNGKIAYKEWVRFKTDLERLHKEHSWRELARLFKKDGQGWAQAAAGHRSIVEPEDVTRAAVLVAELTPEKIVMKRAPMEPVKVPSAPASPSSKRTKKDLILTDAEHEELQQGLQTLYKQHGSWMGATRALGKNPKSSGMVSMVANGKTRGGRPFLDRLHTVQRGETPARTMLKTPRREKKAELPSAEVVSDFQRMLYELGSGSKAAKALGCTESHFYSVRKRGNASQAFVEKVKAVHALMNGGGETAPKPAPTSTPKRETPTPKPVTGAPWNRQAQEHLFAAASSIELEIGKQPKVFRVPLQQFVTRITDLMDELSDG